jgi:hypothetical protein
MHCRVILVLDVGIPPPISLHSRLGRDAMYITCTKQGTLGTIKYLTLEAAKRLDQDLMNPGLGGFVLDQLMELAGP